MLNSAIITATKSAMKILTGLHPPKIGEGSLSTIVTYILIMEESLRGYIGGPFLSASYRKKWRKQVEEASTFNSIKDLLFEGFTIPVVLVENSGRCSKNENDEKILPNGDAWIPSMVKVITDVATNKSRAIVVDKKLIDGSGSDEKGKLWIPAILVLQWFVVKWIERAIKRDVKRNVAKGLRP